MKLVLVSSQPIETSLTQALEFFNSIPNYSTLPTIFSGDPYDASVFMVGGPNLGALHHNNMLITIAADQGRNQDSHGL